MNLFIHHVGQDGAAADFPKTVFQEVSLDTIKEPLLAAGTAGALVLESLQAEFPSGSFNAWGVPRGASSVIRRLCPGDVVLLVSTIHIPGYVPALAEVRIFESSQFPEVSQALWGDDKYGYVFFFKTERLDLTWLELLDLLDYKENYNPRGTVNSVGVAKLERHGGASGLVEYIRAQHSLETPAGSSRATEDEIDRLSDELSEEGEFDPTSEADGRERVLASIVRRRGQPAFRRALLEVYQGRCVISGCAVESILEAAHICPYRGPTTNDTSNGLLRRADIHTLFDLHLLKISPEDQTVVLDPSLMDSEYSDFHGARIARPARGRVSKRALTTRWESAEE